MGCIGLLEGALKYGRTNWRESGVRASIYVDACKRHLDAWFEGEDCAPDSGSPHLANALACLAIIVDAQAAGKLVDDRAYNGAGYRPFVDGLTEHVPRLRQLFAGHDPRQYSIGDHGAQVLDRVDADKEGRGSLPSFCGLTPPAGAWDWAAVSSDGVVNIFAGGEPERVRAPLFEEGGAWEPAPSGRGFALGSVEPPLNWESELYQRTEHGWVRV